tara:strand:+ start:2509 stop:3315 length:807 start_codon:yes stop_codon:yes gene_type:complete
MIFPYQPKKSLGQNFLVDENIINKIVSIGNINKDKTVLEIGAGYGNLTKKILAKNPHKILVIEKDKNLFSFIKENFSNLKNIKLFNSDILKIIENNTLGKKIIVYGNLPYNISTQILAKFILLKKWPPWYDNLILMFQKEVAERIIAKKNTKNFGRLSILCNWRLEIEKHFDVSKNCFYPKPKVNSTVLSFKPKKNYEFYLKDPKILEFITRILFSNRRKMINKNFSKLFKNSIDVARELELDLNCRPEQLNNEIYYKIAKKYENLLG